MQENEPQASPAGTPTQPGHSIGTDPNAPGDLPGHARALRGLRRGALATAIGAMFAWLMLGITFIVLDQLVEGPRSTPVVGLVILYLFALAVTLPVVYGFHRGFRSAHPLMKPPTQALGWIRIALMVWLIAALAQSHQIFRSIIGDYFTAMGARIALVLVLVVLWVDDARGTRVDPDSPYHQLRILVPATLLAAFLGHAIGMTYTIWDYYMMHPGMVRFHLTEPFSALQHIAVFGGLVAAMAYWSWSNKRLSP